ncbi:Hypothetical predicted protein, partial [Paramuricea clavata]
MDYFTLIKSRDSCQPERAIEPSTSSSTSSTPIDHMNDNSIPGDFNGEDGEAEERDRKDMFVPTRKRKDKPSDSQSMSKILKIVKYMSENDPTKELLQFMKEDAEKSRQTELELLKLLSNQAQAPQYVPAGYLHQPIIHHNNHPQQQMYQQSPTPQWRNGDSPISQTHPHIPTLY